MPRVFVSATLVTLGMLKKNSVGDKEWSKMRVRLRLLDNKWLLLGGYSGGEFSFR